MTSSDSAEGLFEGFDEVKWEDVTPCAGSGRETRDALHTLLRGTANEEMLQDAIEDLNRTTCQYGVGLSDATAHALPFIVRMLAMRSHPAEAGLSLLLCRIVRAASTEADQPSSVLLLARQALETARRAQPEVFERMSREHP